MEALIPGVIIKKIKRFNDERGWLAECFRHDEIDKESYPLMSYITMTNPGAVRGPHEHLEQTDFFVFPDSCKFKLYLWDNRKNSPAYGKKIELIVGENGPEVVIVPKRVVHALKNVDKRPGLIINFPNKLYAGPGKKDKVDEIRYENDSNSVFKIKK